MTEQLALWMLAVVTLAGALAVVLARETMRLIMGLGAFMIGFAGFYLLFGMSLLAAAQVFLYVGGVLVLFVFAIMALRRGPEGRAELRPRFDVGAVLVSGGLFALLVTTLSRVGDGVVGGSVVRATAQGAGKLLTGALLGQFELAGGLLLAALVAALAIVGSEGER